MTDTPLFPDLPETLSPFARWKRDNNIITFFSDVGETEWNSWFATRDNGEWKWKAPADYFAQEGGHWGDSRCGEGDTEEEACTNYCIRFNMVHWSVRP